LNRKY